MKKLVVLFLFVVAVFTSCPGVVVPKNAHSVARIKERYTCNIQIENKSQYKLEYKYASVPTREDFKTIGYIKKYDNEISKKLTELDFFTWKASLMPYVNVYGYIAPNNTSNILYTGIDCGHYAIVRAPSIDNFSYPNRNVDGLPTRFVLMIDGDSNCYSLVYDCKKEIEVNKIVITDDTIKRLQTFKDDEFECSYNGKREWYGESVKIQDKLYCFEKYDTGKLSLFDHTYIEKNKYSSNDSENFMYGRIWFYHNAPNNVIYPTYANLVMVLYNDNEEKFYYVKDDASVNLIE